MSAQPEAERGGLLGLAAVFVLPLLAGFTVMSVLLFADVDADQGAVGTFFYGAPVLCSGVTGLVVALWIRSARWGLAAGAAAFVAYSAGIWAAFLVALATHPEWA